MFKVIIAPPLGLTMLEGLQVKPLMSDGRIFPILGRFRISNFYL